MKKLFKNKEGEEEKVVEHFDYEVLLLGIKKVDSSGIE